MKMFKTAAMVLMLAVLLSVGIHPLINRMGSIAAVNELKSVQPETNRPLCDQLLRFGQVAMDRGQIAKAKHFFQEAITVDPTHAEAWKKYNLAFLALITAKVETDESYLPNFSVKAKSSGVSQQPKTLKTTDDDDDDC